MATERGTVIEVTGNTAWVKTQQSAACASCSVKGACRPVGDGKEMKVEALNAVGARAGDSVVISFDTLSLLKVTFLLYLFPVLCLIAGSVAGMMLARILAVDEEVMAAVIGLSAFAGSVVLIRLRGNIMSRKDEYKPKILRIVGRRQ